MALQNSTTISKNDRSVLKAASSAANNGHRVRKIAQKHYFWEGRKNSKKIWIWQWLIEILISGFVFYEWEKTQKNLNKKPEILFFKE